MCGIFGIIHGNGIFKDIEYFAKLEGILGTRGPDAWGVVHEDGFSFAHSRLKILDCSDDSNQPFYDNEKKIIISYNGEIYNFKELREQLIQYGHNFRTSSDTEVIVYAYKEWGISFAKHLEGMFALALYDKDQNKCYLIRDRLGIKPLFYFNDECKVIFSSQVAAITSYPGFKKKLNLHGVSSFLSYRHVLGNETMFEDIYQVPAGSYVEIEGQSVKVHSYWDLKKSQYQNINALKNNLHKVVKSHLQSDVPLGIFLSGGIDSSIILKEMSSLVSNPIKAYTGYFNNSLYDESEYAECMADNCGAELVKVPLNPQDLFQFVPKLIYKKGQPLGMHNEVAMFMIASRACKDVKVVLCGEGADELFGGYGRIFRFPFAHQRDSIFRTIRSPFKNIYKRLSPRFLKGEDFIRQFMSEYTYFPVDEKMKLFTDKMIKEVKNDEKIWNVFKETFQSIKSSSWLDKVFYVFIKIHLPGLLHMVDNTTMAASIEARVPFLDHHLVQYAYNLKNKFKLKWKTKYSFLKAIFMPVSQFSEKLDITKYALKHTYRDLLPKQIALRSKMGFPVPLTEWITKDHKKLVKDYLFGKSSLIYEFEIFDRQRMIDWYNVNLKNPDENFGKKLWVLLNLEIFLRVFFKMEEEQLLNISDSKISGQGG